MIPLAAPTASNDAVLATGLELVANQHRFVLTPAAGRGRGDDPAALLADETVALVIADIAGDARWSLMEAAAEQKRRLVPIAPEGATVPAEWQQETLFYGENRPQFWRAVLERIAPDGPPEPPPVERDPRASDPTTALDPRAAPARRFRAARVLATHGDHETAALALADVARAATPLRDVALDRLGRLGEAAWVGLWLLDAGEESPVRSVVIARQLFRAGDTTTARLRLESLTRHPDRHVRLEALHALGDLGTAAQPEFVRLLCWEEDPFLQLEAARWLRPHRLELPRVITTLATLAGQPDRPRLVLDALHDMS